MDPPSPPPPPPSSSDAAVPTALSSPPSSSPETQELQRQSSMPPPPNPNYSIAELPPPSSSSPSSANGENKDKASIPVPYSIPPWSEAPTLPFFLEVLKDGAIIDNLDVTEKGAYMFGRIDMCDFILEHPTISRFHAVLQFKGSEGAYLYDLGSTHGTFINKKQIKKKEYMELHVGDVIRFGLSTRLYILQGPEELMLPEADLTRMSYAKDREASLRRAKEEAALADGISWGMREDAVEENEDDLEELTWQNYKGELTEKQQKTREKVLKRMEKIAHMKKEMAAIRAKDIAQGGLTQGQQTQIARNEMRISQILEELESLEETLNDSIRESLGARAGKSRGKQKGLAEDEDELLSDDDEFYDRTKKKAATNVANKQSVETADSLLDKKEALLDEIEGKKRLILEEKNKPLQPTIEQDTGDALDAFMTDLSSQLVVDRTVQLEKDISSLQAELDRVVYLLKIADPTGESAKKRATASKENKSNKLAPPTSASKKPDKSVRQPKKPVSGGEAKKSTPDVTEEAGKESKFDEEVTDKNESKPAIYEIAKPQWLGAVKDREMEVSQPHKQPDTDEGGEFIDYKERKKILESSISESAKKPESDLENAAPGLIMRKKTSAGKAEDGGDHNSRSLISDTAGANTAVEDTVALLLKHKRGIYAAEEEAGHGNHDRGNQSQSGKDNKRPRRVLGPEKPAFLEPHPDLDETWVPPEGQSGDGRTSLNDRLGY